MSRLGRAMAMPRQCSCLVPAGEGVTTANLGNAGLVATAFNAEFGITAANGEDALPGINGH